MLGIDSSFDSVTVSFRRAVKRSDCAGVVAVDSALRACAKLLAPFAPSAHCTLATHTRTRTRTRTTRTRTLGPLFPGSHCPPLAPFPPLSLSLLVACASALRSAGPMAALVWPALLSCCCCRCCCSPSASPSYRAATLPSGWAEVAADSTSHANGATPSHAHTGGRRRPLLTRRSDCHSVTSPVSRLHSGCC